MLRGRLSTVMDDAAYGAHQGMMVQMGAHTKDPPMDDTVDGCTRRMKL